MKSLHVINSLNRGGIETWLLRLAKASKEIQLEVLCKGDSPGILLGEAEEAGVRVFHVRDRLAGPKTGRAVGALHRRCGYDVVVSHLGPLSGHVLKAAKAEGIRGRIAMFHGNPDSIAPRAPIPSPLRDSVCRVLNGLNSRNATLFAGSSQGVLLKQLGGMGARRVPCMVWYGPVELNRFAQRVWVRRAGPLRVVNVGSLRIERNQLGIIEVAKQAQERFPGWFEFWIAGEGPMRSQLERAIARKGVGKIVRLLGDIADVPSLLSKCDLALHPSFSESLSLATLEYQAAELPVVAGRITGLKEALAPCNQEWTCEPSDSRSMVTKLAELAVDPGLRMRLGKQGRRYVEGTFSVERCLARMSEIFEAAIEKAQR